MTFWGKFIVACIVGVMMGFIYLKVDYAVSFEMLASLIVLGPIINQR